MDQRTIILAGVLTAALAVLVLFAYVAVTKLTAMDELNRSTITTVPQKETEITEPLPEITKPRVVIKKADRTLELFDGNRIVKTYQIALGSTPEGDKEIEGDGKTPEGDFYIFGKNPNSKYFLSLGISYPNTEDADRGERSGLLDANEAEQIRAAITEMRTPHQKTKLGGEIYIHGAGNRSDWTQGCIAMTNDDIKELFEAIPTLTPVTILP